MSWKRGCGCCCVGVNNTNVDEIKPRVGDVLVIKVRSSAIKWCITAFRTPLFHWKTSCLESEITFSTISKLKIVLCHPSFYPLSHWRLILSYCSLHNPYVHRSSWILFPDYCFFGFLYLMQSVIKPRLLSQQSKMKKLSDSPWAWHLVFIILSALKSPSIIFA